MSRMKEEVIALEAVNAATRALARRDRRTTGEIATEALKKVDEACEKGELGFLYQSWVRDPETGEEDPPPKDPKQEPIRKPLPDSLMAAIRAVVRDPDVPPGEKLEAAILIAHGFGLWSREGTVDPTTLRIPAHQWAEISTLVMSAGTGSGDIAAVNLGLSWMNLGPSAYEPKEGEQ